MVVQKSAFLNQTSADTEQNLAQLTTRFIDVRQQTLHLCRTMLPEDFVIQSMPDVSPTKWHLAHTSWFFEAFILMQHLEGYKTPHKLYNFLFNSYYNAMGEQFCRPRRGQISRPSVEQIKDYRRYIDDNMLKLLSTLDSNPNADTVLSLLELGINHEQQHQELLLCDIKHVLFMNPLYPSLYSESLPTASTSALPKLAWNKFEHGLVEIGHTGDGFHFDNETPTHRRYLNNDFAVANRTITNGEFLEFINDGGYERADLWLSLGWSVVREYKTRELEHERFDKPLYWLKADEGWMHYTLHGLKPLDLTAPVTHISFYEANAFANWSGARLLTEFEWEFVAKSAKATSGNFQDSGIIHPAAAETSDARAKLYQMLGSTWEWTQSAYEPYPGFVAGDGAIGEYNGKFMANQIVLRGGSCATPKSHIRNTYRNFFYAQDKWQFTGIRLAKDI